MWCLAHTWRAAKRSCSAVSSQLFRKAKVGEFNISPLVQKHIFRFDIAMNDLKEVRLMVNRTLQIVLPSSASIWMEQTFRPRSARTDKYSARALSGSIPFKVFPQTFPSNCFQFVKKSWLLRHKLTCRTSAETERENVKFHWRRWVRTRIKLVV